MDIYKPKIVIVGGGFGGLQAAHSLKNANAEIILIDKTNHHLFQPLLYQVAISALSPGDIAVPLRSILRKQKNTRVLMNEVLSIDKENQLVIMNDNILSYDYLILAPGAITSHFGNNNWKEYSQGIKTINDALNIREILLKSFEKAERLYNKKESKKYLNFVIIGGGPTGVELAGAISEIGRKTLLSDFPLIKDDDIKVYLIEAGNKLLSTYSDDLSDYAKQALNNLSVEVLLNSKVNDIKKDTVITNENEIHSACIIWAAGTEANPLINSLNTKTDKMGRVIVNKDLSIEEHENLFVIGDASFCIDSTGKVVPGIAPAATQQAKYVADIIENKIPSHRRIPFNYKDKGNMATIGKASAIAMIGKFKSKGLIAWLIWSFVHVMFLIDFRNKIRVMIEWIWFYFIRKPGARLIFGRYGKKD